MGSSKGGVAHLSSMIADDLEHRRTGLQKPHRKGLADLAASMLTCRSVNTSELLAVLPRRTSDAESRFRYIHRWLKNPLIDPWAVMGGFVPEIAALAGAKGRTVVLMMDQSKISDGLNARWFRCAWESARSPWHGRCGKSRATLAFPSKSLCWKLF